MESRPPASFGGYIPTDSHGTLSHDLRGYGLQSSNGSMVPSFVGFLASLEPHRASAQKNVSYSPRNLEYAIDGNFLPERSSLSASYDVPKLSISSDSESANVGLQRQPRGRETMDDLETVASRRTFFSRKASSQSDGQLMRWDDDLSPGSTEKMHLGTNSDDATGHGSEPPAWSKLKTKAGKQRRRLPVACSSCRQRKVRCSGEEPTCKQCVRSRMPCVYKTRVRKTIPRIRTMGPPDEKSNLPSTDLKFEDTKGVGALLHRRSSEPSVSLGPVIKKRKAMDAFDHHQQDSCRRSSTGTNLPLGIHQQQDLNTRLSIPSDTTSGRPFDEAYQGGPLMYYDQFQGLPYAMLHPPLLLPEGYYEQRFVLSH